MKKALVKLITFLITMVAFANVAAATGVLTYQPDVPEELQ
ncbi:MAG: cyclic lactone autoinducer peptide [Bacillota bacterium]|nr:cyclic lactone autoinducer peptide [Bacillota bacterium]